MLRKQFKYAFNLITLHAYFPGRQQSGAPRADLAGKAPGRAQVGGHGGHRHGAVAEATEAAPVVGSWPPIVPF